MVRGNSRPDEVLAAPSSSRRRRFKSAAQICSRRASRRSLRSEFFRQKSEQGKDSGIIIAAAIGSYTSSLRFFLSSSYAARPNPLLINERGGAGQNREQESPEVEDLDLIAQSAAATHVAATIALKRTNLSFIKSRCFRYDVKPTNRPEEV